MKGSIEDKNKDGIYDRFAHIAKGQMAVIKLGKNADVARAIAQLKQDPEILYAEPNYIVHANAVPNDALFEELYGLNNEGQTGGTADADIDAVEAWDVAVGGSDVVIGVVDTGIDYNHEDLAANVWVNPNEIPGNGVDDDNNGVIDDIHGFNAITGSGNPQDDNDHGTHCSGTIGAVGSNGIGVAGVNWQATIMGLKFLNSGGSGTLEDAISAIDYAVAQKLAGVNLRVLSNSWSGGGFSQGLLDAINAAGAADILFVAAAGNAANNNDAFPTYPASYTADNVVAVAATDHNDQLADFSSFGATSVDLGAPGVDVVSTTIGNTYSSFSGTSMATPHVAGTAALLLSANSTLSTAEVKDALLNSGDPIAALEGITLSGRRLNAAAALDLAGPPIPRFNVSVTPASQIITQGDTATSTIDVTAVAGFTGTVSFTASSNPAINATVTVTPSVNAPGTGTLTVATTTATAPGTYNFTVTGTSGDIVRTRTVSLRVRAFGTVDFPFPSSDTPIFIPDANPVGINSTINVNRLISIEEVNVDVNITHTYIGDLLVTLTSPQGTTVVLHDHAGGSSDNIHQTFSVPSGFTGQEAAGDWVLHVQDDAGIDVGTLDDWTLHIIGTAGQPSFTLAAGPANQSVTQGDSAAYDVSVGSLGSFSGSVALSLTSDPPLAATATFSPSSVTAPGTSVLTVATNCDTAAGDYTLTITGTGTDGTARTATVALNVQPFGTFSRSYTSSDTPIFIPDEDTSGITSTINVTDDVAIADLQVEVNITHTFIGDLSVALVRGGTTIVLHNHDGGSDDDLHQTYSVPDFNGASAAGQWRLVVVDDAFFDVGTLDDWSLHVDGEGAEEGPTASFTFTNSGPTFNFTDTSSTNSCGDGSIVSWAWNFGDGSTSNVQNPSHTYTASGTYTVTLTVTDNNGLTGSASQTVEVTRIAPKLSILRVVRDRPRFEFQVDLRWTGAEGTFIDLYRNAALVNIQENDGQFRDIFRHYDSAYTWKICEQRSTFCSNEVSIDVGPDFFSASEVTVTTKIDGVTTVSRVAIGETK